MPESAANAVVHVQRGRRSRRSGFTLIDVLVSMGVIAVLMSLLSPSLTSVRESARQVVCRSNTLQIGIGISMHARENRDFIPPSVNSPLVGPGGDPWQTMSLRLTYQTPWQPEGWDGLGVMYAEEILPAPKLFYCPSHRGDHPFVDQASMWAGAPGEIVGNFQYRAAGLQRAPTLQNPSPPPTGNYETMFPGSALVADGMRTQLDFNHQVGANVLRANLSVDWFTDRGGSLLESLPRDGSQGAANQASAANAWLRLDDPN